MRLRPGSAKGGLTRFRRAARFHFRRVRATQRAPRSAIAISGEANINEGSSYSLNLGAVTDPGADTVSSYIVHWGDGAIDTYTSNGIKSHTYSDGPNTYAVTVDLVDGDGTFLNRANAF